MRIAIAGLVHETNTFSPLPSRFEDFGDFSGGPIPVGAAVLERTPPRVSLQGFAAAARAAGHTLLPLCHAHAQPSGRIERGAFERIVGMIADGLRQLPAPPDAVFLELHGAMVVEQIDDADAEVVQRVRAVVGAEVPIVATLDSHANVPRRLVDLADALVAYRTYPHVDMAEAGERALRLLDPLLAGQRYARAFRPVPFLMPLHLQTTLKEPCRSLYARIAELEADCGDGTTLSLLSGFPLADVPHCGPAVFGYGPDARRVEQAVARLHDEVLARESAFRVELPDADAAVAQALAEPAPGTIVLADVQDNAGGGAGSDTVWIVDALLRAGAPDAVVGLLFDPQAAAAAHAAGEGAELALALGGKLMPGHVPVRARFTVERLADGPFTLHGPMLAGGTMDLGPMAQLRCGGVRVVVTSRRHWYVERECFRRVGIDPGKHRIVVVKSTNHYRADFAGIATQLIEFAAPSAVMMDPSQIPYRHLVPGKRLYGGGPAFATGVAA